ncbi:MAG: thioredoxin domain-containing protein [Bradymonadaceae bacterium]
MIGRSLRTLFVASALLCTIGLLGSACDPAPGASGGGGGASGEASSGEPGAEGEREGEQVASNLPGVETMPASVHEEIQAALEEKKQKDDPTFRTHHKTEDGLPKYTNRLILADSPYLQQHAHNPTNWFSWGEEAFEKAAREDKPVLLSVGYSTCHWCHVMERKSFEDLEIARYLNKHYVPIKVDRERRPHIDDTYMSAVRMLSGSGGWPMTVWLTPQKLPFMGGTYFPPERFLSLLKKMKREYDENPSDIRQRAQEMAAKVNQRMEGSGTSDRFPDAATAMNNTYSVLDRIFDDRNGGFGRGQKFPSPGNLRFLMRYYKRTQKDRALEMVRETLDAMANGGIYDDVGGGFHRYSTDPQWMVPHFEKMLYDNAQLATVYTEAWQLTGDPEYRRVAKQTLNYLIRDMESPTGGIYAATSADSRPKPGHEREEGAFFVWTPEQVRQALPPKQAKLALAYWDITEQGNFEGANILHTPRSRDAVAKELGLDRKTFDRRLEKARQGLYEARDKRPHPHRDNNLVTGWNGLALEAFAEAAVAFDNERWRKQAREIGRFLLEDVRDDEGRLHRNLTSGELGPRAFSSDYAFAIAGLLSLYEATAEPTWLKSAIELQDRLLTHYWDDEHGGYFQKANDAGVLLARKKPDRDGTTPSSNSYGAWNLLRLYQFTLDKSYEKRAREIFEAFGVRLERRGASLTYMLAALNFLDAKPREIAFVAPEEGAPNPMWKTFRTSFLPNAVVVRTVESDVPELAQTVKWMQKKKAKKGRTTAYVCRDFTCKYPTTEPATFEEQIADRVPLETD